jgi:hypothetical protein
MCAAGERIASRSFTTMQKDGNPGTCSRLRDESYLRQQLLAAGFRKAHSRYRKSIHANPAAGQRNVTVRPIQIARFREVSNDAFRARSFKGTIKEDL